MAHDDEVNSWTTWHITFGTYGTRLHGGGRATVAHQHNQRGERFVERDANLEQRERDRMRGEAAHLTRAQRRFVQASLPVLCQRGGWRFRMCAASHDHVHVLLDADSHTHGETVRRILKRWLTQALDEHWDRPSSGAWWAEQGSCKAVRDDAYRANAQRYILRQRAD